MLHWVGGALRIDLCCGICIGLLWYCEYSCFLFGLVVVVDVRYLWFMDCLRFVSLVLWLLLAVCYCGGFGSGWYVVVGLDCGDCRIFIWLSLWLCVGLLSGCFWFRVCCCL